MIRIYFFLYFFFSLCCMPVLANSLPFSDGEELFFRLRWGVIVGGNGSLKVEREKDAWLFTATGKSTPWLDNLYRVRLRIDARTDLDMTHFYSYEEHSEENRKDKSKSIFFNPQTRTVNRIDKKEKHTLQAKQDSLFDPLSLFYSFRTQEISSGSVLQTTITDGKKIIRGSAEVTALETITLPAGTFRCWRIEPDIKDVGGVFKKSSNARMWLWVSADKQKIPLRIRTKIALGSITADLTGAKGIDLDKLDSRLAAPVEKEKWNHGSKKK